MLSTNSSNKMTFILTELFGNSEETRITEVFMENPDDEFLLHQVALAAEVGFHEIIQKHIIKLIDNDIVISRLYNEFDNDIFIYKLNIDNPKVKMLIMLERTMVADRMNKLLEGCYCD